MFLTNLYTICIVEVVLFKTIVFRGLSNDCSYKVSYAN